MEQQDSRPQGAIGFLSVRDLSGQGLVGGYLLLNASGRPLEFHCTAPVKPSRAQQILFGPTLEPYVYGEQIGQTLIAKAAVQPLVICTDTGPALAVRDFISVPVALVLDNSAAQGSTASAADESSYRVDVAHAHGGKLAHFSVGANRLAVAAARDAEKSELTERLQTLGGWDLMEPFTRIRQAIEEAHRAHRS